MYCLFRLQNFLIMSIRLRNINKTNLMHQLQNVHFDIITGHNVQLCRVGISFLWHFQFNYLEVLSIRELSDHKGQLRAADWLSGLSLVSWHHYWPLIGWHEAGLPWGDWLPVVRLGEDLVLMDYLWWGEYQEIRSVHKHCNWHLHQVKQYWLIRKNVRTKKFSCLCFIHLQNTDVRC